MTTVVASGTDWVKLLAEDPGRPTLSQASLDTLVTAAHGYGKFTVCHSIAYGSANMALDAAVDQIHHAPLDKPHDTMTIQKFLANGIPSCPTLAMMQAVVDQNPTKNYSYAVASASVTIRGRCPDLRRHRQSLRPRGDRPCALWRGLASGARAAGAGGSE